MQHARSLLRWVLLVVEVLGAAAAVGAGGRGAAAAAAASVWWLMALQPAGPRDRSWWLLLVAGQGSLLLLGTHCRRGAWQDQCTQHP